MRHLLKTLMVLSVIFIVSGCEKEPDLTVKKEDSFTAPFHENITETYVALFQLISTGMREAITKPQLYFLAEVGDTRDCPDSSVDNTSTYPKTLSLDFVNCNSAGIIYNGAADIIFNAALGEDAASGPEIMVPAVSGIMINGYTLDLTGPITLERNGSSTSDFFSYDFLLGGDIVSTNGGTTTTLPAGSCGIFSTGFQDGDDPDNPISFVDNPFDVSLKQTNVICASEGVSQSFCTMTGEEPLSLNPANCSCPTQGDLEIITGACGTTGGAISDYDFGFDGRNSDVGICDNFVNDFTIIDFLSYEGVVTATDGPLAGRTSIDIGVDQNPASPEGTSLQLTDGGNGTSGHGFFWTDPAANSYDMINPGQTITNTTTPNTPWINEIHYDNDGRDADEGIEIAGPAGLDLGSYCLRPYNGNGGVTYGRETSLRGMTIPDEGNGYGTVFIPITGLQNDGPDAIAFYRKDNVAVNFCSSR